MTDQQTQAVTQPGGDKPAKPAIALIVVAYNSSRAAISLYERTRELRGGHREALLYIIVDNNSLQNQVALLQAFSLGKPDVLLLLNGVNGGYARGNNLGIRTAAELGVEYCLIVNSDITFRTADFAERLRQEYGALTDCGLIGPRIQLPDGSPQGPLPPMGIINSVLPLRATKCDQTCAVYATAGCCLFGATEVFRRIGLFDEATFLYREEQILAERLGVAGLRWYYVPDIVVLHEHIRKIDSVRRVLSHKKYEYESSLYYFRRYKARGRLAIMAYRVLFALKLAVFIMVATVAQGRRSVFGPRAAV